MISLPWHKLLTRRFGILALSLIALACIPLAGRDWVPDAGLGLLLPFTIAGLLCAWALGAMQAHEGSGRLLLAAGGPLLLVLFVGRAWEPLARLAQLSLLLLPRVQAWGEAAAWPDAAAWLSALQALGAQLMLIGSRVSAWLGSALRSSGSEDPMARALVWGAGLWWLSGWAGWQLRRHARPLVGLVPATLLLGLLLNNSTRHPALLWIYLVSLVLILGLVRYEGRMRSWLRAGHDYVELTDLYSYLSLTLITVLLAGAAYLAYTTSFQELLDRLREKQPASAGSPASAYSPTGSRAASPELSEAASLLEPHRILDGPQLSQDVVMVVSTGELPKMPAQANPYVRSYYWRTITYEHYTGGGWSNPRRELKEVPAGEELVEAPSPGYRTVNQQVWFPLGASGRLYWTGTLLQADVPVQAAWHAADKNDLLSAFSPEQAYRVRSVQTEVSAQQLRAASTDYPEWVRRRYLELPEGVPARVLVLARDLTASAASPYDRAMAIETYLRKIPYSLDVPGPPPGREAVDYFVFDLKKGYCDYYATAMVVLSRAAGLPARFVSGYATGAYDAPSATYQVRQADAHSWAEIYFPRFGWVEFEATAAQPQPPWQVERRDSIVQPASSYPASGLVEVLLSLERRIGWETWLASLLVVIVAVLWEPLRIRLLAHTRPQAAPRLFYQALRRSAQPLTGAVPASRTIQEYNLALRAQIAGLERAPWTGRWVRAANMELDLLSRLYSASLFAMQPPCRDEIMAGARAWSRLRLRLWAAGLIYRLRRRKG